MEIQISSGRILVDAVRHVIDHEDVQVFEIDLGSKYPGKPAWTISSEADGFDLFLFAIGRTRGVDESATEDTLIRFRGFDADKFTGIAEAGRYTARLAFYRRPVD